MEHPIRPSLRRANGIHVIQKPEFTLRFNLNLGSVPRAP